MPPHSLAFKYKSIIETNLNLKVFIPEIVYLKIKDGAYVINLDEYKSIGTHWIALYVNGDNITYFDSSGVECIPKEIKKFLGTKNIEANIYRIEANN